MTDEESGAAFSEWARRHCDGTNRDIAAEAWIAAIDWAQEWRPMEEYFEDRVDVLILMNAPPHTVRVIARRYTAKNGRKDWLLQSGAWVSEVSAIGWLPLPPLPKEKPK
jgi:hypothetical protein